MNTTYQAGVSNMLALFKLLEQTGVEQEFSEKYNNCWNEENAKRLVKFLALQRLQVSADELKQFLEKKSLIKTVKTTLPISHDQISPDQASLLIPEHGLWHEELGWDEPETSGTYSNKPPINSVGMRQAHKLLAVDIEESSDAEGTDEIFACLAGMAPKEHDFFHDPMANIDSKQREIERELKAVAESSIDVDKKDEEFLPTAPTDTFFLREPTPEEFQFVDELEQNLDIMPVATETTRKSKNTHFQEEPLSKSKTPIEISEANKVRAISELAKVKELIKQAKIAMAVEISKESKEAKESSQNIPAIESLHTEKKAKSTFDAILTESKIKPAFQATSSEEKKTESGQYFSESKIKPAFQNKTIEKEIEPEYPELLSDSEIFAYEFFGFLTNEEAEEAIDTNENLEALEVLESGEVLPRRAKKQTSLLMKIPSPNEITSSIEETWESSLSSDEPDKQTPNSPSKTASPNKILPLSNKIHATPISNINKISSPNIPLSGQTAEDLQKLKDQGERYWLAKRFPAAIEVWCEYLAIKKSDPVIEARIAQAQNRLQEAMEIWERAKVLEIREEALELIKQCLQIYPYHASALKIMEQFEKESKSKKSDTISVGLDKESPELAEALDTAEIRTHINNAQEMRRKTQEYSRRVIEQRKQFDQMFEKAKREELNRNFSAALEILQDLRSKIWECEVPNLNKDIQRVQQYVAQKNSKQGFQRIQKIDQAIRWYEIEAAEKQLHDKSIILPNEAIIKELWQNTTNRCVKRGYQRRQLRILWTITLGILLVLLQVLAKVGNENQQNWIVYQKELQENIQSFQNLQDVYFQESKPQYRLFSEKTIQLAKETSEQFLLNQKNTKAFFTIFISPPSEEDIKFLKQWKIVVNKMYKEWENIKKNEAELVKIAQDWEEQLKNFQNQFNEIEQKLAKNTVAKNKNFPKYKADFQEYKKTFSQLQSKLQNLKADLEQGNSKQYEYWLETVPKIKYWENWKDELIKFGEKIEK